MYYLYWHNFRIDQKIAKSYFGNQCALRYFNMSNHLMLNIGLFRGNSFRVVRVFFTSFVSNAGCMYLYISINHLNMHCNHRLKIKSLLLFVL